jgi:hypothetical protein
VSDIAGERVEITRLWDLLSVPLEERNAFDTAATGRARVSKTRRKRDREKGRERERERERESERERERVSESKKCAGKNESAIGLAQCLCKRAYFI